MSWLIDLLQPAPGVCENPQDWREIARARVGYLRSVHNDGTSEYSDRFVGVFAFENILDAVEFCHYLNGGKGYLNAVNILDTYFSCFI